MRPPWLDFRVLKRTVSVERVLAERGLLSGLRRRGGQLVGACPIHGGDNVNAFVVHPVRNLWRCFTRCDAGGDLVELVRRLDNCSYREVAYYLASLAGAQALESGSGLSVAVTEVPTVPARRFRPYLRRLWLDPAHPFLARKAITPETARRFEVGAYRGTGMLEGCVAVRLHDPQGLVLGYAGRRLQPDRISLLGKWVFPPGLPRNSLLYGHHHIVRHSRTAVVLVECPWGVMRLAQLGVPAVGLLGCHLSSAQHALLKDMTRVVLLMDGDIAGRKAAATIRRQLSQAVIVDLPDGLDPDDLPDQELVELRRLLAC